MSGQMVETVGLLLFARYWHIYAVPPILVTYDAPVNARPREPVRVDPMRQVAAVSVSANPSSVAAASSPTSSATFGVFPVSIQVGARASPSEYYSPAHHGRGDGPSSRAMALFAVSL
jgi:hypothetical protein